MDPLNILLVDDSRPMTQLLSAILSSLGHRVVGIATSGKEAIEVFKVCKPDLVTMDIAMPDMDGLQATKAIMAEHPEARIVMVTAYGEDQMVLNALKAGAKGYVIKPFDRDNVADVILRACKRKA
jgi:two-component system chemotaxis response regulator CheY